MTVSTELTRTEMIQIIPPLARVRSAYKRIARLTLLFTDAIMVVLAFALAYWLRFTVEIGIWQDVSQNPIQYVQLAIVLIPLWLAFFALMRLYDFHYLLGGTIEYARALNACTSGMMLVIITSFMIPEFQIARGWLLMAWLFSALFVCSGRLLLRRIAYRLRRRGLFISPAVIVGTNQEAQVLSMQLRNSLWSGLAIIGFIAEAEPDKQLGRHRVAGLSVIGSLETLPEIVQQHDIEEVIIASTALSHAQLITIPPALNTLPGVNMRLSSGLYEILTTNMRVCRKGSVPLMSLDRLRLDPIEQMFKTAVDYLLILCSLPFLLPIFALIALLIKWDSPGPVLYRRRVLGTGGRAFDAFKFRTMVIDGEGVLAQHPELLDELKRTHKLKNDPRITRIGQFLRRTSLDELPQLLNVLAGQMSLVGPRMISPEEANEYGQLQLNLLTVKPGLTGLWQVSGRSDLDFTDRIQLDMHYIRNYSLWLDLQILLLQTIPVVLKGKGAY